MEIHCSQIFKNLPKICSLRADITPALYASINCIFTCHPSQIFDIPAYTCHNNVNLKIPIKKFRKKYMKRG